ncbi:hypothetical protein OKA05_24780 [Luteolibacter arcticus]|uniref:Uncharacterized protein n=1 Tax=Luteolibacter arcticus TaxID=1581411 RepID=A0ABT3GQJ3_9BACT|nr:hypothetical protein [Luteolibacter arcticus]MCW1925797.1 hypothetical protein [Luteolibacter arcticus]
MTTNSFIPSPPRQALLPVIALMAALVLPSFARDPGPPSNPGTPKTAPAHSGRPSAVAPARKAAPAPIRRGMQARPDPRYRPAANFAELQAIAGEVARASGRKIHWRLRHGENPGPLVRIRGTLADCTIFIHPIAAKKLPANTWAFLFGHEFAHMTEQLGAHTDTNPDVELKADIAGARYAMAAGFRLDSFLGWVLTEPNKETSSHGSLHRRVESIAKRLGIRQNAIRSEAQLYSKYRTRH